jgi:hypothetical protein
MFAGEVFLDDSPSYNCKQYKRKEFCCYGMRFSQDFNDSLCGCSHDLPSKVNRSTGFHSYRVYSTALAPLRFPSQRWAASPAWPGKNAGGRPEVMNDEALWNSNGSTLNSAYCSLSEWKGPWRRGPAWCLTPLLAHEASQDAARNCRVAYFLAGCQNNLWGWTV